MIKILRTFAERLIPILVYSFPFLEINFYFAPKSCLMGEADIGLKYIYIKYLLQFVRFYEANSLFLFILMVGVFIACSKGYFRLTKFVRFNAIQAILLSILCSCIGQVYFLMPTILYESNFGVIFAVFFFLSLMALTFYSIIQIMFGRYPLIPLLSNAAKIQVQRGNY